MHQIDSLMTERAIIRQRIDRLRARLIAEESTGWSIAFPTDRTPDRWLARQARLRSIIRRESGRLAANYAAERRLGGLPR